MIDITIEATERLLHRHAGRFAEIGNVADFEAISNSMPRRLPAAYVLPLDVNADSVRMGMQVHTFRFGVLVILRHAGDALGKHSMPTLEILRNAVHEVLSGWKPEDCMSIVSFERGSLIEFREGATIWRDDFTVRRDVTVTQPD